MSDPYNILNGPSHLKNTLSTSTNPYTAIEEFQNSEQLQVGDSQCQPVLALLDMMNISRSNIFQGLRDHLLSELIQKIQNDQADTTYLVSQVEPFIPHSILSTVPLSVDVKVPSFDRHTLSDSLNKNFENPEFFKHLPPQLLRFVWNNYPQSFPAQVQHFLKTSQWSSNRVESQLLYRDAKFIAQAKRASTSVRYFKSICHPFIKEYFTDFPFIWTWNPEKKQKKSQDDRIIEGLVKEMFQLDPKLSYSLFLSFCGTHFDREHLISFIPVFRLIFLESFHDLSIFNKKLESACSQYPNFDPLAVFSHQLLNFVKSTNFDQINSALRHLERLSVDNSELPEFLKPQNLIKTGMLSTHRKKNSQTKSSRNRKYQKRNFYGDDPEFTDSEEDDSFLVEEEIGSNQTSGVLVDDADEEWTPDRARRKIGFGSILVPKIPLSKKKSSQKRPKRQQKKTARTKRTRKGRTVSSIPTSPAIPTSIEVIKPGTSTIGHASLILNEPRIVFAMIHLVFSQCKLPSFKEIDPSKYLAPIRLLQLSIITKSLFATNIVTIPTGWPWLTLEILPCIHNYFQSKDPKYLDILFKAIGDPSKKQITLKFVCYLLFDALFNCEEQLASAIIHTFFITFVIDLLSHPFVAKTIVSICILKPPSKELAISLLSGIFVPYAKKSLFFHSEALRLIVGLIDKNVLRTDQINSQASHLFESGSFGENQFAIPSHRIKLYANMYHSLAPESYMERHPLSSLVFFKEMESFSVSNQV